MIYRKVVDRIYRKVVDRISRKVVDRMKRKGTKGDEKSHLSNRWHNWAYKEKGRF